MNESIDNVLRQMRAAGMVPPDDLRVGAGIVRYGKGSKSSWYTVHEFALRNGRTVLVGAFGDWKLQISQKLDVDWKGVDASERRDLQAAIEAREKKEREKRASQAEAAKVRARGQWRRALTIEQAKDKGLTSPYLEAKGLTPESLRFANENGEPDGTILVAAYTPGEEGGSMLVGLQKIAPDGEKRFNRGMPVAGSAAIIGRRPKDGDTVFVAEGYATGRSARMAWPEIAVFCAWNCGNLVAAAKAVRSVYPHSPVIFLADDDYRTDGNPGVTCAHAAARAIGNAWVVVPLFPDASTRGPKDTDFNDLMARRGLAEVRAQTDPAVIMGSAAIASLGAPAGASTSADTPSSDASSEREPMSGDGPPDEPPDGLQTPEGPHGDEEDPRKWAEGLKRGSNGSIKPLLANIEQILDQHPDWRGVLAFDQYAELIMKVAPPPWHNKDAPFKPGEWSEYDDYQLRHWLSRRWFDAKEKDIMQAVTLVARRNWYHPLMDRLEAVAWDGESRLRTWLIRYLGACTGRDFDWLPIEEQDKIRQYVEKAGMKWMIGAVARVATAARPGVTLGCQMDTMLVLEGEQGIMKSTALRVLGDEWFTDEKLDFGNKDSLLILQGRWIIEMAELEGLNKAETASTKQFITKREDLFRAPYGRKLEKKPRRCVFAGTVNHDAYLRDDSGNRRFWPVRVEKVDLPALREDVAQLWAEALHRFKAGEPWWVLPDERELFEIEQDKRFQEDPWHELIAEYLIGIDQVTGKELLADAVKVDKPRWDKMAQMRVASVMRRLKWKKKRVRLAGGLVWVYIKPGPATQKPGGGDDEAF